MKVLESRRLNRDDLECFDKINAKVYFIRIDPEDISQTIDDILKTICNLSWLNQFDDDFLRISYQERANDTIEYLKGKISKQKNDSVTKETGEYIISVLSKNSLTSELNYTNIPLAELVKQKVSGNPGFDFHSENSQDEVVIFGEAKYVSRSNSYGSALRQINKFINKAKDIKDIPDLRDFCSKESLNNVTKGIKGYAAAFSAKNITSDKIIKNISKNKDFIKISKYEEIIIVAVNL